MAWKGKNAGKNSSGDVVDQALAGMKAVGGGRLPVGNSIATSARNSSGATGMQKVIKKGNAKGGSPDNAGTATHRSDVAQERLGPRFSINVALPGPQSPEAGLTQGNGRIVPAVMGSRQNFGDQRSFYGSR